MRGQSALYPLVFCNSFKLCSRCSCLGRLAVQFATSLVAFLSLLGPLLQTPGSKLSWSQLVWTECIAYSFNKDNHLHNPRHQAIRIDRMQYLSDKLDNFGYAAQREVALR